MAMNQMGNISINAEQPGHNLRKGFPMNTLARICILLLISILILTPDRAIRADNPVPSQENGNGLVIVDAQTFVPDGKGGFQYPVAISDAGLTALDPIYAAGAWADGTSLLIIRLEPFVAAAAPVVFTLSPAPGVNQVESTADRIGSLTTAMPGIPAPDALNFGSTSVTVAAGSSPVIFYRPPNDFLAGALKTELTAQITATESGKVIASGTLELVRPTVILVHGFASGPATWGTINMNHTYGGMIGALLAICPTLTFDTVDYSNNATSGLDELAGDIPGQIATDILVARKKGLAATRPDLVAHSYGGLLSAWYAANMSNVTITRADGFANGFWSGRNDQYIRPNDFGKGDIRRLVTLGSPLNGSPLADGAEANYTANSILFKLTFLGYGGDGEAIDDLMNSGSAAKIIEQEKPAVAWVPVVGIAGTNPAGLQGAWAVVAGWAANAAGMNPQHCDLVVFDVSQEDVAGTPAIQMRTVTGVIHTGEPSDGNVENQVVQLLDLSGPPADPPAGTPGAGIFFNSSL